MSNIINVTPDNDGRVFIELYGEKTEIHESMFNEEGVATIKKFGTDYEVHIKTEKKSAKKTKKSEAEDDNAGKDE